MRLAEYLDESMIFLDIDAQDKNEVIAQIVNGMKENKSITGAAEFLDEVYKRESLGSTCIGNGVALPHARTKTAKEIIVAFARLKNGVDFEAEDREPVKLVFLLGTPVNTVGEYLKLLAKLSKLLKKKTLRNKLLKVRTPGEILNILEDAED